MQLTRFTDLGLRAVMLLAAGEADGRRVTTGSIAAGANASENHIAKAVALGATAVAIGKLQGWGLAANGAEGVKRVLEILQEELVVAMALMGVTSIDQLSPAYVTQAEPVAAPHEMSAWANMPGDRIM